MAPRTAQGLPRAAGCEPAATCQAHGRDAFRQRGAGELGMDAFGKSLGKLMGNLMGKSEENLGKLVIGTYRNTKNILG